MTTRAIALATARVVMQFPIVNTVSDINCHFCGSAERDRTSPFSSC